MLRYGLVLTAALAAFWIILSGYFTGMLLTLGVISILTVLFLCARMGILDEETSPYLHIPKTLSYYVWLFREIFKANITVVRAVLNPDLVVSPKMTRVPINRHTDMGAVMFANSITLTPGTVSVEMNDDDILVHALLTEMSNPDDFAEMGSRAGWSVGEIKDAYHAKEQEA
ncbi:MAG: Na+/H+ antiporter subunit E [Maricaulaceae bacterium]